MTKITSFSALLFLFIFMFVIFGMDLFSNRLRFNYNNEPVPYFDGPRDDTSTIFDVPNGNFDNFLNATTSTFIVIANDGWSVIYFDHYRVVGAWLSSVYFILLLVVGQWILFNLFLAILLKEFDDRSMIEEKKKED